MAKRALLIVLDSVGCGNASDAASYGDSGADTLGHLFGRLPWLKLPHLDSLGLAGLMGRNSPAGMVANATACRLNESSAGKDTTTGHWELMGLETEEPFFTCTAFPEDFVEELSRRGRVGFIGNRKASGTNILGELGAEHIRCGKPILYTSADSVLQIAAHEEHFGLERLYDLCRTARALLDERGMRVGRVIARPFTGDESVGFRRTPHRHDYSLTPGETTLDRLVARGVEVIGIGKISDIFAGSGISRSYPTASNREGMERISELWSESHAHDRFLFANLVDFDMLYGHRRDPEGYARCLMEFDAWLGGFLPRIEGGDLLIITADHGNDPYHTGTDHTREQVPCLMLGGSGCVGGNMRLFRDVGGLVECFFI